MMMVLSLLVSEAVNSWGRVEGVIDLHNLTQKECLMWLDLISFRCQFTCQEYVRRLLLEPRPLLLQDPFEGVDSEA
jgi:hypothetical protein